jgi:hypothetical protein
MSLVSFLTGTAAGAMSKRNASAARYVRLGAAGVSAIVGIMLGAEVLGRY